PIKMAGKTGTAQAHSYGSGPRATLNLAWEKRDHAWFIAFAPHDAPRYACAVLVEHGGWGASAAAPRAREIMRVALLKDPEVRARIVQGPVPQLSPDATLEGVAPPLPDAQPTQPFVATPPVISEGSELQ
ncbi:MAG: mrdA, partial [Caulobacteraceae bacterium]|nr:mrdA [Caulobacteraceae bacterium]